MEEEKKYATYPVSGQRHILSENQQVKKTAPGIFLVKTLDLSVESRLAARLYADEGPLLELQLLLPLLGSGDLLLFGLGGAQAQSFGPHHGLNRLHHLTGEQQGNYYTSM